MSVAGEGYLAGEGVEFTGAHKGTIHGEVVVSSALGYAWKDVQQVGKEVKDG